MTNPPTDERRAAFEAWARDECDIASFDNSNEYVSLDTRLAFRAWKAALSHQGDISVADLESLVSQADKVGVWKGDIKVIPAAWVASIILKAKNP